MKNYDAKYAGFCKIKKFIKQLFSVSNHLIQNFYSNTSAMGKIPKK